MNLRGAILDSLASPFVGLEAKGMFSDVASFSEVASSSDWEIFFRGDRLVGNFLEAVVFVLAIMKQQWNWAYPIDGPLYILNFQKNRN